MKEINLKEILDKFCGKHRFDSMEVDDILETIKEACNQAIDLCAENARTGEDINSYTGNTGSEYPADIIVNKQSILKTKNQII